MLLPPKPLPAGVAYIPGGPTRIGGDPEAESALPTEQVVVPSFAMQILPVTNGQYAGFLTDLAKRDPDAAWARVPRQESGLKAGGGQYWTRPDEGAPYEVPAVDRDGDAWDARWPVANISWHDACAYAEWLAARDGLPWRLPTEHEWEKAARGVDGRVFPWGDGFDPTLCAMRLSRPGRPLPRPVGEHPEDRSPYGVRDLAGGVREWTSGGTTGGQTRAVRGSSWSTSARVARAASRTEVETFLGYANVGFRLVFSLP